MKPSIYVTLFLSLLIFSSEARSAKVGTQIAFLADVHLHDIYASPEGTETQLLPQLKNGNPVLMRSMMAQLSSTRLFNENYYVFIAALDDLVRRNVKLVVLPGDFTDDGQPMNVLAVKRILDHYTSRYHMRFFVINGNHDPVRPFTQSAGKSDFLGRDGLEVALHSAAHSRCTSAIAPRQLCSDDIKNWGYQEIMNALAQHGFTPHSNDVFYETPFTSQNNNGVTFESRQLQWCDESQPKKCVNMPDSSYVVEPIKDVWLLAIDANVYIPKDYATGAYEGSGNAGYNAMRTYKKPILSWIESVARRAREQNKQLIAFSHFPATDFYDNTNKDITQLFGPNSLQTKRLPTAETAAYMADLGLQLHFAGHMHINDTGSVTSKNGNRLINIQVPSLAAYRPGYKLLTFTGSKEVEVTSENINDVAGFDELFPLYENEWQKRQQQGMNNWSRHILTSQDYLTFTDQHLLQLIEQRFLPKEWPPELVNYLHQHSIMDLITLLEPQKAKYSSTLAEVPAITLVYDFYRLKNAADTAMLEIDKQTYDVLLSEYSMTMQTCIHNSKLVCQLRQLLLIMQKMFNEEPADKVKFSW